MVDEQKPVPLQPAGTPVKVQTVKYAPPPPDLPILGKVDPRDINFFGRTNYVAALEEKRFIFGIKREDRRRHMYVIGKSGVGKSKLLELLIRQDIESGRGVCLIDPSGDLIDELLRFIPERRIHDVCIIDPRETTFPVAFNPFAHVDESLRHQLSQSMIEIIERQFGSAWTPRIEHLVRFALLALFDFPRSTISGLMTILTDDSYRAEVAAYIKDDLVKRFWAIEFKEWRERFDIDTVIPLLNKLTQFLSDPLLKPMFSQHEDRVHLTKLLDQGKIIFVNLARGRIGEDSAAFFGGIVLAKLKEAGMLRAQQSNHVLADTYIYFDEFHHLSSKTLETFIAEAAKFGFCLTVSHQYMGQLSPRLLATVLGSAGSIISFRVGGADAVLLEDEFSPIFKVKDMINLGRQEFYIKMMIDGETYDAFSANTLKVMPPAHLSYADRIIEASRRTYAVQQSPGMQHM